MSSLRALAIAAVTAVAGACGPIGSPVPAPEPQPADLSVVEVTNDHFNDVVIYVVRSGLRERLGTVARMQTRVFEIPEPALPAHDRVQLIAEPVGSLPAQFSTPVYIALGTDLEARIMDLDRGSFPLFVDPSSR